MVLQLLWGTLVANAAVQLCKAPLYGVCGQRSGTQLQKLRKASIAQVLNVAVTIAPHS